MRVVELVRHGAALAALAAVGAMGLAAQEQPREVTDKAVKRGQALYLGKGDCARCHGEVGEGSAEGDALIAGTWKLGDGSYDWLVHVVRHSGIAARGRDGDPVPMRGPTLLSEKEVREVAAYVWSISRGRAAAPAP